MSRTGTKVIGGLGWSYAERISAQVVSLLVSIVLARLLTPDEFGIISLVMIFITLCDAIVMGGLGNAVVQKKEAKEIDVNTMLTCSMALSILLYIAIFFLAPYVSDFFNTSIMTPILRVLGIRVLFSGFNSIQRAWIQKKLEFKKFFYATSVGVLVSAIIGIYMAYTGFGVWALVAQYLSNTVLGTIVLIFVDDWKPRLQFSWERAKGMLSYGINILISTIIYTVVGDIRSILIGKKFGASDLAFFDQGKKIPNILVVNINSTISSVLFPIFSESQTDLTNLKRMCRRSVKTCTYLVTPLLLGLFFTANDLIKVIFTEKWIGAVPFLQILTIAYLTRPFSNTCNQAIMSIGRSDISMYIMTFVHVLDLLLIILSVFVLHNVLWIAYSLAITEYTTMIIFMMVVTRYIGYSLREQLKDITPSILLSLAMGLIIFFIHFLPISDLMILTCQIILGISFYFGVSYLMNFESFKYIMKIVEEKTGKKLFK